MAESTAKGGRLLRRAASWTSLAFVCAMTFEMAARVDDWLNYGAPVFGSYDMDDLFQPTPRGYRGVAHASFVKWGLNGSGFRGPEIKPDTGQTRILTYGASETFGIYEDPDHEFPRVLEHDLNSGGAPGQFEVINAGMPGMRVGSGITYIYDIGKTLHPRVVIIYPTPTHYIGVTHPYCGRPIVMPVRPAFALPQLRITEKIKDRLKEALPASGLTMLREAGIAWANRHGETLEHVSPLSMDALDVDLNCAIKASRDIGAVPILVTHANRFGRTPGPDDQYFLTGWRLQYPEMRQSGLIDLENRANARIRSVAAAEGVKVIDAAAALSGNPSYFADHAHFTNSGASKMGALLSGAVLETLAGEARSSPTHLGLNSKATASDASQ
jgi:lysophospholipase L1-like esterase